MSSTRTGNTSSDARPPSPFNLRELHLICSACRLREGFIDTIRPTPPSSPSPAKAVYSSRVKLRRRPFPTHTPSSLSTTKSSSSPYASTLTGNASLAFYRAWFSGQTSRPPDHFATYRDCETAEAAALVEAVVPAQASGRRRPRSTTTAPARYNEGKKHVEAECKKFKPARLHVCDVCFKPGNWTRS